MRNFLRKSGLTAVILVSLAAMAFLPQNVAQWIATSLGNDTTASITIIDTKGNMLFPGTHYT